MQTQKYNTAVLNNTTSNVILTTMLTVCSNTTTLHYTIYIYGEKNHSDMKLSHCLPIRKLFYINMLLAKSIYVLFSFIGNTLV